MDQKQIRDQAIKEWMKCRDSDKYFIFNYCYTFDPRKAEKIFVMKPWPHLIRLIDELNDSYEKSINTIIEKSRDMGISWTIMAWQLHKVLFKNGFMSLNISRREWEVEDTGKTPRSLFGRLDFMYSRLPSYIKCQVDNPFLTFKVKGNNSFISGESANVNAGRDMQYSFIFIDEAGHIQILDEMWKSVSNSANFVVLNSTPPPGGKGHKFAQLRFNETAGFKVLRFHWKEHPEKNELWYAKKTLGMTDEDVARELDINYEKSVSLKIYHEWDDIHIARLPLTYDRTKKLYLAFDFGLDDPESVLFIQKCLNSEEKTMARVIAEYEKGNLLTNEHFKNIQQKLFSIGYNGKLEDLKCYGDPEGIRRERTSGRSVINEYANLGLRISVKEASLQDRRRSVKLMLKTRDSAGIPRLIVSPTCTNLINSLRDHQRVKSDADAARKDGTCHSVTALEYFCINEFPPLEAAAIIYGKDPEPTQRGPLNMRPRERRSLIWV